MLRPSSRGSDATSPEKADQCHAPLFARAANSYAAVVPSSARSFGAFQLIEADPIPPQVGAWQNIELGPISHRVWLDIMQLDRRDLAKRAGEASTARWPLESIVGLVSAYARGKSWGCNCSPVLRAFGALLTTKVCSRGLQVNRAQRNKSSCAVVFVLIGVMCSSRNRSFSAVMSPKSFRTTRPF